MTILANNAMEPPLEPRFINHRLVIAWALALLGLCLLMLPPNALAAVAKGGVLSGAHGDLSSMPKSCRACHRGMAMAIDGEEAVCLTCHGPRSARDKMVQAGYLKDVGLNQVADISNELRKPYNHPVLTRAGIHRNGEALPEELVNAARHSECVDCHHPHMVEKDKPFRGLKGKRVGNFIADLQNEYELCYKCHGDSANLPANSTSKKAEFKTTNPSFHPVEAEGRSTFVISLKAPYAARKERPDEISQIGCSDCHGSDNPNAPKGPHGSNHRGLLKENYDMVDGLPESEAAYALCYRCHNRTSILGNESFPWHAQHIEGNRATNQPGTSCFTCHDAHGSTRYPALLRFNEQVVRPNVNGKLEFKAQGVASRHGSCLLNCHGVEHNPKSY